MANDMERSLTLSPGASSPWRPGVAPRSRDECCELRDLVVGGELAVAERFPQLDGAVARAPDAIWRSSIMVNLQSPSVSTA